MVNIDACEEEKALVCWRITLRVHGVRRMLLGAWLKLFTAYKTTIAMPGGFLYN